MSLPIRSVCANEMTCQNCSCTVEAGKSVYVFLPEHYIVCTDCYDSHNAEVLEAVKTKIAEAAQAAAEAAAKSESSRRKTADKVPEKV